MLEFGADAGITPAQILGIEEFEIHPGAARCPYVPGEPLMWERLLVDLPTRMYELHNWYMQESRNGVIWLEVRIGDEHFFQGTTTFHVPLEELHMLFNQDALDYTLMTCWTL